MSNIYYREKKLSEDVITSAAISVELVKKVFASSQTGLGLASGSVPLHNISWRKDEIYYKHADFGQIYIPANIQLTDGVKDYFIVLINDSIEFRYWPGSRIITKNIDGKINHVPVTEQEMQAVEKSFLALVDFLGLNKTFEERYAHVKGIKLSRESLVKFLSTLSANNPVSADKIFSAALNPLEFYKNNKEYVEKIGIREPSKELYISVMVSELISARLAAVLDWKATLEDINFVISNMLGDTAKELLGANDTQKSTLKMLNLAAKKLKSSNIVLFNLVTNSDSYIVLPVGIEKVAVITEAAKECKLKLKEL